jgi:hypothetical protein
MKTTRTLINCGVAAALALAPSMQAAAQGGNGNGNGNGGGGSTSSVFVISGNVYDDANGLMDGTINGTAINSSIYSTGQLRVILVNNSATTVANSNVVVGNSGSATGYYTISGLTNNQYALILTSSNPSVGGSNPIIGLYSEWAYVGEGNSASGDGVVDGSVTLAAGPLTALTVNFGIDRRPTTNNYTMTSNQLDAFGRIMFPAAAFTGSDGEDGTYPTGLINRSVDLYKATNATLYYNGVQIQFPASNTVTTIDSFDYTKLRLQKNAGASSWQFSYSVRDNAYISELVPSVINSGAATLPMTLASYSAKRQGVANMIEWITASEKNTAGYQVERSYDGSRFESLAKIPSLSKNGSSTENLSYSFEDATADLSATAYYRIREIAFNGEVSLSPVMKVAGAATAGNDAIRIAPNPSNGPLNLNFWQDQAGDVAVSLVSTTGQEVYRESWNAERGNNSRTLAANNLPAGTYFVKVRTATGSQMTQPVVLMQ